MSDLSHALEVSPDAALQFVLTRGDGGDPKSDGSARCVMTLTHPGKTKKHIAFKVKTTQPRRYLVRPNQGIVAPGASESVTILLVEKDKQMLLQSFERLGQSALDHSKDKFLVQSCTVGEEFAIGYSGKKEELAKMGGGDSQEMSKVAKELAESLTGMWNSASGGEDVPIFNKKLQVRHVVASDGDSKGKGVKPTPRQEKPSLETMSPDQMFSEITSLRRKYDELVTFSVNLTAERDILNNTLEQTKRDLNREMARNKAGATTPVQPIGTTKSSSGGLSFLTFLFVAALFFLIGIKLHHSDMVEFLFDVPVLGDVLRVEL